MEASALGLSNRGPDFLDFVAPWLAEHRTALYFADLAGFRWRLDPEAAARIHAAVR